MLTLELDSDLGLLSLFTTLTSFGTPRDITLAELVIGLFYPADEATARRLATLAASVPRASPGGEGSGVAGIPRGHV